MGTLDLGRYATQSPIVRNESMNRAQSDSVIECPFCHRKELVPGGMMMLSKVADRKTFCHSIFNPKRYGPDGKSYAIIRRGAML